jgi:hypothetical protein
VTRALLHFPQPRFGITSCLPTIRPKHISEHTNVVREHFNAVD